MLRIVVPRCRRSATWRPAWNPLGALGSVFGRRICSYSWHFMAVWFFHCQFASWLYMTVESVESSKNEYCKTKWEVRIVQGTIHDIDCDGFSLFPSWQGTLHKEIEHQKWLVCVCVCRYQQILNLHSRTSSTSTNPITRIVTIRQNRWPVRLQSDT